MQQRFLIFFIQLLTILKCVQNQIVPSFKPLDIRAFSNGSNFTSLLLIQDMLFVGAKDNIYQLNSLNIQDLSNTFNSINLQSSIEQKEHCLSTYYDEVKRGFTLFYSNENSNFKF
jgi:hypothetical protein